MNVYLKSDFHDYYDHMFDLGGEMYSRMSVTTFPKALQFHSLNGMGLATPHRGMVDYMATILPNDTMLVIYEKECSHRGEDKYGGWLAVDYNTSPGLSSTPVQEKLSATEVVDEIKAFMETKPVFNLE